MTIRTMLVKFMIGTTGSLHMPNGNDQFDPMFWSKLSFNPGMPTRFIRDNMDKWEFRHCGLSRHPNVDLELIADFPNANWDYNDMSSNPNITWDYVSANSQQLWDSYLLSSNPAITLDVIKNNPQYDWCAYSLLYNPNMTMDFIKNDSIFHNDVDWIDRIEVFMNNPNASPSDIAHIITNPDLDTFERNHCHRVTPELVKANPDIGWIPERLAANPNFDLATLYEMYPLVNKEWFRNYYMLNPNVTADDVVNYGGTSKLEKASTVVHWRGISDTVLKTDCWAWDFVIMNPTIFDCEEEIKLAKAALVILKAWRESMSNPRYRLCRQRLMREFAELDPDV